MGLCTSEEEVGEDLASSVGLVKVETTGMVLEEREEFKSMEYLVFLFKETPPGFRLVLCGEVTNGM